MTTKTTTLTIICAWCGRRMGTKDGKGQTGTTHGMCTACYAKQMKEGTK